MGLGLGIRAFRFGFKVSGALCLHNGSRVWGLHYIRDESQWASGTKYPNIIVRSCVSPCLSLRLDTDPHSTGLNLQKPEVCYL